METENEFVQDTEPTVMIFRKYPDTKHRDGDVIALMPERPASCVSSSLVDSLASDGFSGASMQAVYSQTRPATPAEYAGLLAYLEAEPWGFKVKPMKRETPQMRAKRYAEWRKMQS